VRCAPDGTIIGRKLVKSSGVAAWDDAVLRAIDRTEVLPLDEKGKIAPVMLIDFRPKDF
jgi:colicin import membrane protein